MHARLRGPNNLFILHHISIEPDFPCLADEIAEPRPDMNIKVAAFTVSEKSINTSLSLTETSRFYPFLVSVCCQTLQTEC